jgi:tetratricopeptide (TPR) repeat protein
MVVWLGSALPRERSLLLGWLILYGGAVVIFFVNGRFRLGLIPILILLAAWGVSRWRLLLKPLPLTVFALCLVLSNASWLDARITNPAQEKAHTGAALITAGEPAEALAAFKEAYELEPSGRHAYLVGQASALGGNPVETRRWFALAREAGVPAAMLVDMGATLAELGLLDEAAGYLREAVRVDPDLERARVELGLHLSAEGRGEDAILAWESGLRRIPGSFLLRYNLAIAYGRVGRIPEAKKSIEEALGLQPGDADALEVQAWLQRGS